MATKKDYVVGSGNVFGISNMHGQRKGDEGGFSDPSVPNRVEHALARGLSYVDTTVLSDDVTRRTENALV